MNAVLLDGTPENVGAVVLHLSDDGKVDIEHAPEVVAISPSCLCMDGVEPVVVTIRGENGTVAYQLERFDLHQYAYVAQRISKGPRVPD